MNERHNIRNVVSEGDILFVTRAIAVSAFPEVPGHACILGSSV
jgi:hypothetical protein